MTHPHVHILIRPFFQLSTRHYPPPRPIPSNILCLCLCLHRDPQVLIRTAVLTSFTRTQRTPQPSQSSSYYSSHHHRQAPAGTSLLLLLLLLLVVVVLLRSIPAE